MKLAHALSKVTTPIFMGIVYFVVLTPIGFIRRSFGGNPLVHKAENESRASTANAIAIVSANLLPLAAV
jgi:hypothetical protein